MYSCCKCFGLCKLNGNLPHGCYHKGTITEMEVPGDSHPRKKPQVCVTALIYQLVYQVLLNLRRFIKCFTPLEV